MTVVILGIDALDPDLVDPDEHPNLILNDHRPIDTIESSTGEPSTHELWPTIITGLSPAEHGLTVEDDGVAWGNPLLEIGSSTADYLLPDSLQTQLGAWLLTNTNTDAFRIPKSYYSENNISTVFEGFRSATIGIPNYVVSPDTEDREHNLRRNLGNLFERDPDATSGHKSADPYKFYEQCMEMAMVRIARARRGLRGGKYELVFAYTSGLDLIGHVTYDLPKLQRQAYNELDEFVGELIEDLNDCDELLLVSDHGLQDGIHTSQAMVSGTNPNTIDRIDSVMDVRAAIEAALEKGEHEPEDPRFRRKDSNSGNVQAVREQLEDLGYMQ